MRLTDSITASLDKKLSEKCQQKNIPGMALCVFKEGEPIYEKCYGYRHVDHQLPVTNDTVFPAASVTKSFTALSIMLLEDKGKLSVDDLVTDWLPELTLPKRKYQQQLKIHHLLSNTSGLPGLGAVNRARAKSINKDPDGAYMADRLSYIYEGREIETVVELMDMMSNDIDYSLLGEPGTTYNYSNEGFALLQEIIERASGQSFNEFINEHVLRPLNMSHSTFLNKDLSSFERVTELYGYTKDFKAFHSPAWWDVGHIYTNGSLKTTVLDLMKYLELYRLDGTVNGQQIISQSCIQKMMTPHFRIPTGEHYGYGLKLTHYNGISLIGHPGNIKGGSAYIMLAKELGITIAVLTNIGELSAESLALTALEAFAGLRTETTKPTIYKITHEELKEYTGLYLSAEGRKINITLRDQTLHVTTRNNAFFVNPATEDTFTSPDGAKYKFLRLPTGQIAGLLTGFRFIPKAKTIQEALHVTLT